MKKVLILAYDFPPYVSVGGLRPYSWYKYFKEFGFYPVVVTRQWDNEYGNELDYIAPSKSTKTIVEETEYGTIIRTPYKPNLSNKLLLKYGNSKFNLIRKIITAYYEVIQFFFFIGTKSGLYHGAKEYLKDNKVDTIIATGEPFILFKYASKLSNTYNIPWISDYRDPWSQDINLCNKKNQKKFNQILEKQIVKKAALITTASSYFKTKLYELFPTKFINIVNNGFDHQNATFGIQTYSKELIHIGFVGTIYLWHPIESVLKILMKMYKEDKKVQLNLYGINDNSKLVDILNKHPEYQHIIKIYPRLSNQLLLEELSKNHCLLLFNYYLFMGTKIYDYLLVNRPILFCFTNDSKAKELKEKHYGFKDVMLTSKTDQELILENIDNAYIITNEDMLKETLCDFYDNKQEFSNPNLELNKERMLYSRQNQTYQLSKMLNKIIQQ